MMNTTAFRPPQSVDEVIYRIQAAPVGRCSFKLPVSPRFCYEALRAAFEKAVNASYINCIYDEEQCMVLNTIAYWLVGQSYKCGLWLSGFGGTSILCLAEKKHIAFLMSEGSTMLVIMPL